MELENQHKVDFLLKLLEENGKATEWLKDLDYKIAYSIGILYFAGIAWLATQPTRIPVMWVQWAIGGIGLLALIALCRNHFRHRDLICVFRRVVGAAQLDKADEYGREAILSPPKLDLKFYMGRLIYGAWIIFGAIFTWIFVGQIGS